MATMFVGLASSICSCKYSSARNGDRYTPVVQIDRRPGEAREVLEPAYRALAGAAYWSRANIHLCAGDASAALPETSRSPPRQRGRHSPPRRRPRSRGCRSISGTRVRALFGGRGFSEIPFSRHAKLGFFGKSAKATTQGSRLFQGIDRPLFHFSKKSQNSESGLSGFEKSLEFYKVFKTKKGVGYRPSTRGQDSRPLG